MSEEAGTQTGTEGTQDTGQAQQTPVIWDQPIPKEGAPPVFGKYNTWQDAAGAFTELQTSYGKSQETLKTAQSELEDLRAKQQAAAEAGDAQTGVSGEEWVSAFNDYINDGKISAEAVNDISQKTGVPPQDVADYLEFKRAKREQFMTKAGEEVEGLNMPAVEAWIQSGESPFSAEAIRGFMELANHGDTSWIKTVWSEFQKFVDGGGIVKDPVSGKHYGAAPDMVQGRPAGFDHPGFKTAQEYIQAMREARANIDPTAMDAVRKKLAETPDSVTSQWKL